MNALALPDGRLHVAVSDLPDPDAAIRAMGLMSATDAERLARLERARYVLVRMDQGEVWRCGNCGTKHRFPIYGAVFTKLCVPRPWRGLREGLTAYFENIGGARPSDLSPAQTTRLRENAPRIGSAPVLPSLADSHPNAAQALGTASGDVDYVGWLLGSVVEITEAEARRFADAINVKARRILVRL